MKRFLFALLLVVTTGPIVVPDMRGEINWPCYHGARRDNISTETNLLRSWAEGGPKLLWVASGIGQGFSSVAVAGGRIFTAGMIDNQTHVIALDLNGKILWQKPNGSSWRASENQKWAIPYSGSRGTPTVDRDLVYHLAELGDLTAFRAATGERLWHRNLLSDFDASLPKYGYSESVLIKGNRLFCCPGGKKGYIVALDKVSGKTIWVNTSFQDPVGYSSLVIAVLDGVEQLVGLTAARVFGVRTDNGELLWEYPFGNRSGNNATDPIIHNGKVYASSGYGKGSVLIQPCRTRAGRFEVKELWSTALLDNHHGGVVLVDGYLFGAGHQAKGWTCLEFATGRECWRNPGKGSLTYADGCLYCLEENGTISLVPANHERWEVLGSFSLPRGGSGPCYAHPVVCGGRLYVRHGEKLYAYSIAASAEKARKLGCYPAKAADNIP